MNAGQRRKRIRVYGAEYDNKLIELSLLGAGFHVVKYYKGVRGRHQAFNDLNRALDKQRNSIK